MNQQNNKQRTVQILALFIFIFGMITIVTGSSVIFNDSAKLAAGNIVLEIVWFNVIAGLLYLLSAWGLWGRHPWVRKINLLLFAAHLVMMVFLLSYIFRGGSYEIRTLYAFSFRTFLWGAVLLTTCVKAEFIPASNNKTTRSRSRSTR